MSHPNPVEEISRQQPWIKRFPDRELADTCELNCEEYGFLQRLRDFSMVRGGIPDSGDLFFRLAKTFQLSKYKLKKLWPVLENFFTLRDGVYYYDRDEERRLQVIDSRHKRQVAGRLGAEARWSREVAEFPKPGSNPDGNATAGESAAPSPPDGMLELDPRDQIQEREAAAAARPEVKTMEPEAAGAAPEAEKNFQPEKIQRLTERCSQLGLQLPDRKLSVRLLEKFPSIEPEKWPRFPEQRSPGLWVEKSIEDMTYEIARQNGPPKKTYAQQMAENFTRRQEAKAKASG
jgi:hypothetical protein